RYLDNAETVPSFDLPCALQGTPFQQKVWNELKKIPCGTVITYGELANKLGTSARAIGNACRKNPIPLVIPCHRVVAANGIGGYSGDTNGAWLRIKSWLLRHEGVTIS
ncbi:MAG: methylated-DNA--[protein]-cysteine S-methyltransferase, partial [Gammaproteobacteria bacterium]|nr:methylated-DNA--[protein]-cysteine S-methyltransferase [Gammaproteobacteria bacterium]